MSNGLDPDQDQHSVGPDLGPNCLQMLSADDKSHHQQGKSQSRLLSSALMFLGSLYCKQYD